jgi:outer membrane protein OmpA-like peptidoglycan-associated protein
MSTKRSLLLIAFLFACSASLPLATNEAHAQVWRYYGDRTGLSPGIGDGLTAGPYGGLSQAAGGGLSVGPGGGLSVGPGGGLSVGPGGGLSVGPGGGLSVGPGGGLSVGPGGGLSVGPLGGLSVGPCGGLGVAPCGLMGIEGQSYIVFFDWDRAELTPPALAVIAAAVRAAQRQAYTRINLTGHTDLSGSNAYNAILSRKRADVVLAALVRGGIGKETIYVRALGPLQPVVSGVPGQREPQNRRVEIVVE